jgi:hypothetical protein
MTANLLSAIRCALAITVWRQTFQATLVIVFTALSAHHARTVASPSATVYDTLLPNEFGGESFGASLELGQTAILAGAERRVVSFDVTLGSNLDTPFRLKFYQLDGPGGLPQTLIWESAFQNYPWVPPSYNIKVVHVDIPTVLVPDSFAWTIAPLLTGDQGRISTHVGTAARVGQTGLGWDRPISTGQLQRNSIQFVMSARIMAIPEPSTGAVALVVACGAVCVRQRRCGSYATLS